MFKHFQPSLDETKDRTVLSLFEKEIMKSYEHSGSVDEQKIIDFLGRCVSYAQHYYDSGALETSTVCAQHIMTLCQNDTIMNFIPDDKKRFKRMRAALKVVVDLAEQTNNVALASDATFIAKQVKKSLKMLKKEEAQATTTTAIDGAPDNAVDVTVVEGEGEGNHNAFVGPTPSPIPVESDWSPSPISRDDMNLSSSMATLQKSTSGNTYTTATSDDNDAPNNKRDKLVKKKFEATGDVARDTRTLELLSKELVARRTALELQGATIAEMAATYQMATKVADFVDRAVSFAKHYSTTGELDAAFRCALEGVKVAETDATMCLVQNAVHQAKLKYRAYSILSTLCATNPEHEKSQSMADDVLKKEKDARRSVKNAKKKQLLLDAARSMITTTTNRAATDAGASPHEEDSSVTEDEPNEAVVIASKLDAPSYADNQDVETLEELARQLAADKLPTLDAVDAYASVAEKVGGLSEKMAARQRLDASYVEDRLRCLRDVIAHDQLSTFRIVLSELGDKIVHAHISEWVCVAVDLGAKTIARFLLDEFKPDPNMTVPDDTGRTLIHVAASNANVAICDVLAARKANINAQDVKGRTPMMLACLARADDVCAFLLQQVALDITIKDMKGNYVLQYAFEVGMTSVVTNLLDLGALKYCYRPDLEESDAQRLISACEKAHHDIARLIVNHASISFDEVDSHGCTALHYCAQNNLADIAAAIAMAVGDVNPVDSDGATPLHISASRSTHLVRILINAGADMLAEDFTGNTPLLHACCAGHSSIALLLLESGDTPNHSNHSGNTALHFASIMGLSEVVACLLQLGADVNAIDDKGNSALHYACSYRQTSVAAMLLRSTNGIACDVNTTNLNGYTPLLTALGNGMSDIAVAMIQAGADCAAADPTGSTVLSYACDASLVDIAYEILQRGGIDVNMPNVNGSTALHYAARHNLVGIVRVLLEYGVDINSVDAMQCTPLHYAALHEQGETAALLIEHGASVHAVNSAGRTPFDHAMLSSSTSLLVKGGTMMAPTEQIDINGNEKCENTAEMVK